jgi:hypothetical protein
MLVLALASPDFLAAIAGEKSGNELSVTLAFVRQSELDPPVEARLRKPFSLSFITIACPEDSPEDFFVNILRTVLRILFFERGDPCGICEAARSKLSQKKGLSHSAPFIIFPLVKKT